MLVLAMFASSVAIVVGGAEVKGLSPCSFPAIFNFGDSNSDTGAYSAALGASRLPDGARTFWILNMGPIGCLPINLNYILNRTEESFDQNGCNNRWNRMAVEYNKQLKNKLIKLRRKLPEAAITYVDVYTAKYRLICNAKNLGFTNPLKYCIQYIKKKNGIKVEDDQCNASAYISWDGTHYTDAANHLIAKSILNGSLSDPPLSITHACHKHVTL
ncbi:GDSL esterase/lipase [Camellia lanceoleosa]|uniref:GDSL esterase/lipase n=1 Tax=Camellia lanceoleosa TaxID=1840588 RepID=A0ACC0HW66_9ERIC|nr:GDSL esterase/lipase [Camellia lanceoleosa]